MNLINLTMELSLVYLSLFTLIGETTDLSYNQNEILGLVTIIFMLLAQVIVLILMIFEFFYMIYHCIKFCTKKQPSQINDRNELKRKQTTKDGFKNTEEDPDFIAQEYLWQRDQNKLEDKSNIARTNINDISMDDLNNTNKKLYKDPYNVHDSPTRNPSNAFNNSPY